MNPLPTIGDTESCLPTPGTQLRPAFLAPTYLGTVHSLTTQPGALRTLCNTTGGPFHMDADPRWFLGCPIPISGRIFLSPLSKFLESKFKSQLPAIACPAYHKRFTSGDPF
jgi:hypothetical protein